MVMTRQAIGEANYVLVHAGTAEFLRPIRDTVARIFHQSGSMKRMVA